MNKKNYYHPEIIAFSSWALVMTFEILWARIVGPYIGTSIYVWTSLIAIILWALSLGYFVWGKLADSGAKRENITQIYTLISFLFLLVYITKDSFLMLIAENITDIRWSALIIASILFWPISFLLGLIPPIVTKSELTSIENGGKIIGRFESLWTIWSIVGTIGSGFFLIPFFWVNQLLLLLWIVSLLLAFYSHWKKWIIKKLILIILYTLYIFFSIQEKKILADNNLHIIDSEYSHITIWERTIKHTRPIRELRVDNITHAGMYLDSNELLHEYTKYYHLFNILNSDAKNVLMLGWAAYSFPKSFLLTYPDKSIDVVEIDPKMTELAEKYFALPTDPRLHTYHQDARVYLNKANKKYDAILGDAFGSFYSVPYQLTTQEVVQKKYNLLTTNWLVILNIIGALEGEKSKFIQSEFKTYASIFPHVFLIPVKSTDKNAQQNIMLVALKNPQTKIPNRVNLPYDQYLAKRTIPNIEASTPLLTDNYAPVDYLVAQMLR